MFLQVSFSTKDHFALCTLMVPRCSIHVLGYVGIMHKFNMFFDLFFAFCLSYYQTTKVTLPWHFFLFFWHSGSRFRYWLRFIFGMSLDMFQH
eukprot:02242.XXX_29980_26713_1 [CDS] Oithona nana genome sequencing.